MLKFSIQEDRRRKVKIPLAAEISLDPADVVEVAVDTVCADYVPKKVTLRARISGTSFTGKTTKKNLDALELDPNVKAVSVGQPLRLIKPRSARKRKAG
jgi:hypothetical protein